MRSMGFLALPLTRSMCFWHRPLAIARLTFASLTLASPKAIDRYTRSMCFTKQAFRPDQKEQQRQHIREPVFDAAAGQIELLDQNRP